MDFEGFDEDMFDGIDPELLEQYYEQYGELPPGFPGMDGMEDMGPPEINRIPIYKLYKQCVRPSLLSGPLPIIAVYLICCLFTNVVGRISFLCRFRPIVSVTLGLFICARMFETKLTGVIICAALVVAVARALSIKYELKCTAVVTACIASMLACQFLLLSPVEFNRIRGPLMIVVMKCVSLSMDGVITHSNSLFQDVMLILCYLLDVGSIAFGPWISYAHYAKTLRSADHDKSLISVSLFRALLCVLASVGCLLYSSCFIDWLLPDELQYYSDWILAFRDAQSFRFSHFFVSYLSEASAKLSGINFEGFIVSSLLHIEMPRSLVDVVVSWNVPMHTWLKNYVFTPIKLRDGPLLAIWMTYFTSSFLHGLNFQLSSVLFSLGLYTYAEHELRKKLSGAFDACIGARKCKENCQHAYKYWNPIVLLFNSSMFAVCVFHLAYLGAVFSSNEEIAEKGYEIGHTLHVWKSLGFASHYLAGGMLLFAKAI